MRIFLVGPPGVGKTVVGAELARVLGASFVDTDDAIERRAGKPCTRVIIDDGIERFRDLESSVLERLRATPAWEVVATGGGLPVRPENRARMRALGLIVGLRGSAATVARGLERTMAKREHLRREGVGAREHAERVLRERRQVYADVDVGFDVDGTAPDEVARAVAAWIVAGRGLRVDVHASHAYPVLVRAGVLEHVGRHLADLGWAGRIAVVGDRTARRHHVEPLLSSLRDAGMEPIAIRVPEGERAKSRSGLDRLWRDLAVARVGRDGGIVAVGGGATGDLAGFAAATYMRGIALAHVPTTLLAMVDSSIGGKTGIDLPEGKNLVGAFHAPAAVFSDPALLATLPERQVSSGLAEVVKTAFLADRESVAQTLRSVERVLARDLAPTTLLVLMSAEMKGAVVSADEREAGLRELLNFGHTFGHAYEAASGFRATHGESVAVGMVFATALAEELGLAPRALRPSLEDLLSRARLPIRARIPRRTWTFLGRDKKARAGRVRWILPRRVGRFSEVTDVGPRSLQRAAGVVEGRAA
ncbi:MAG: 3-dehydroquinate synthase [Chloroflexota bacterium]|nr:3-dehydroquinate synthase [Chloroflexota bacterium]